MQSVIINKTRQNEHFRMVKTTTDKTLADISCKEKRGERSSLSDEMGMTSFSIIYMRDGSGLEVINKYKG